MKAYYEAEAEKTIKSINELKSDKSFTFAIITDSHLSDNRDDTCENIKAVDEAVNFQCVMHLGDFLCGNIPEKVSMKLLKEELECYRSSTKKGELYASQGNHDGYRDETYQGQTVTDMAIDENWYNATCFADENKNLHRPENKPYYYIDFPEHKMRFIVLCTNSYKLNREEKIFEKIYGMLDEQLEWLGDDALKAPQGYHIFVFSHIHPFVHEKKNPNVVREYGKYAPNKGPNFENAVTLIKAYNDGKKCEVNGKSYDFSEIGGAVGAWFFGHDHCDANVLWEGIRCVGVASQTAYIPQLWDALGEFPYPREIGRVTEDAWDGVVINTEKRTINLIRFGAGDDRAIKY